MTRAASLIGPFLAALFAAPSRSALDLSAYRASQVPTLFGDGAIDAWENEGGLPESAWMGVGELWTMCLSSGCGAR